MYQQEEGQTIGGRELDARSNRPVLRVIDRIITINDIGQESVATKILTFHVDSESICQTRS